MASVERAMAKAAASLLPGLLPTPPRSTVTPCLVILPSSFASKPKPSRADSVERWDAHKTDRKPGSPTSSCGSSSSTGRGSSGEQWDMHKKCGSSSSSSTSSYDKWDSNKRGPPSRASSAGRWDSHKKARSAQVDAQSGTGDQEEREVSDKQPLEDETMAMAPTAPAMCPVFSGSNFFASPEPSLLPIPTFFRSWGPGMMPVPAH